jgi:predicted ATP-dependent endonuclease of OLD family
MLFAKRIIFVEGISEQLLLPIFARYLKSDLIDSHVAVINVGGRYFSHFLKLFDRDRSKYAINKRVAVITDLDPVRKKTGIKGVQLRDLRKQVNFVRLSSSGESKVKTAPKDKTFSAVFLNIVLLF